MTDSEAIECSQRGNQDAFAELYGRHKSLVYRRCLQILRDPHTAEDASQEVFLKAWAHLGQFSGNSAFSTWLYRIATNESLVHLRKKPPTFVYLDDSTAKPFEVPDPRDTYQHVQLSEVLDKVRPQDEQVLGMWLDGHRNHEIAAALGTNLSNIKSRIHRTKNALREALA